MLRVYRGGLTKDAEYLRGLEAMWYLQNEGDLNPLLVGKIAVEHIPIINELQYRDVFKPVPVLPRQSNDSNYHVTVVARYEILYS